MLTRMSIMMLLAIVYVLILFSSDDVMIFLSGIFVGVLILIWSILMVECIAKVLVENWVNH